MLLYKCSKDEQAAVFRNAKNNAWQIQKILL